MTYLDPTTELDRLRHENAQLRDAAEHWRTRSHQLTETLRLRSAALNRTGTQNDHLRATVAACPRCSTLETL